MPMKARTICLYRLLDIKSIIETVEGQIAKTTTCFVARGFGKTVMHLLNEKSQQWMFSQIDSLIKRF